MSAEEPVEFANNVETELKDVLTLSSCTKLISELIKFILYRKRQLPYTFDRLKYLITQGDPRRDKKTGPEAFSLVERQFKLAKEALATLELIFNTMEEQLASQRYCRDTVTEVALLFGSSPLTPKQVYRIHLPSIQFRHSSDYHPERKHLVHLLHSVILSKNLCAVLGQPLTLTNAFFFIKRITDRGGEDDWNGFIPKISYEIPQTEKHFHIRFYEARNHRSCYCEDYNVYSTTYAEANSRPSRAIWYQANTAFRGFSDVYVDGVSVSDLWLR